MLPQLSPKRNHVKLTVLLNQLKKQKARIAKSFLKNKTYLYIGEG